MSEGRYEVWLDTGDMLHIERTETEHQARQLAAHVFAAGADEVSVLDREAAQTCATVIYAGADDYDGATPSTSFTVMSRERRQWRESGLTRAEATAMITGALA